MNEYQTHTCLKTQNNLWIRWDHAAFLHFKNSAIPFASFCFLVPQCYLELYNEFKPFRKRNSPISLASRCTRFGMPPPWSEILKMTWMSLQQSQQEHRNQPTISEKKHLHCSCSWWLHGSKSDSEIEKTCCLGTKPAYTQLWNMV